MIKITSLLDILHIEQNIAEILTSDSINTVKVRMNDGTIITLEKAVAAPVPVEKHTVAYFGYPSSEVPSFRLSRRVIVVDSFGRNIRGYETSNDADYQFKSFSRAKMTGLYFVDEKVTSEDKKHLTHL